MNEDSILNLFSPEKAASQIYFPYRYAEGHYRIASPLLALALCLLPAALILYGQIRRDLWSRRAFINIGACILVIIAIVMARSTVSNNIALWPLLYLSVIVPIGFGLWLIRPQPVPADEVVT